MAKAYKITLTGNATKNYSADVLVVPTATGKSFSNVGVQCSSYSQVLAGYDPVEPNVTFITTLPNAAINLGMVLPDMPLITLSTNGDSIVFSNGNSLVRDGTFLRPYINGKMVGTWYIDTHANHNGDGGIKGGAAAFHSPNYTSEINRSWYVYINKATEGFPTSVFLDTRGTTAEKKYIATFLAGAEEGDIPTPGGDDPDPYDEIDGEADLPGDSTLDLPPEPTTSPVDSGLFSLFAPSTTQMRSLADYLWTDFGGLSDSIPEMLGEIVEALKRSVSNPLNSIFGLSIIASQGLTIGSSSSVHIGFWDTGISMPRISKQYFTVDCGSLSFTPVCGNTFLDYAPYSKFTIFLPYVGMRILDANDVVGHSISVVYRGDCVSGALVCFIKRDGKIIAEHSGNCALNLPLSADSWANTISSAARIAISGDIAPAMAGLSIGSASGAVKVAAAVATNPSALAPQVGQSGAVAGSSGHMGSQKPFILREAVRFHSTEGFNSIIGYPAFYYRKLGDCRGFTQCLGVHLNHTPATGDELKEIEELLKQGVII